MSDVITYKPDSYIWFKDREDEPTEGFIECGCRSVCKWCGPKDGLIKVTYEALPFFERMEVPFKLKEVGRDSEGIAFRQVDESK